MRLLVAGYPTNLQVNLVNFDNFLKNFSLASTSFAVAWILEVGLFERCNSSKNQKQTRANGQIRKEKALKFVD